MVDRPIEDFPPDEIGVSVVNAIEIEPDKIAVACQLSAEGGSINRYYVTRLHMPDCALDLERQANLYLKGYAFRTGIETCLEVGNVVFERSAERSWTQIKFSGPFLQDCYSGKNRFLFGAEGSLFAAASGEYEPQRTEVSSRLMAMTSGHNDIVYIVGEEGTLLRGQIGRWEQIDLGMGIHLRSVSATSEHVLIGGEDGYLARLSGGELREIGNDLTGDILAICRHDGVDYIADSAFGISVLRDDDLVPYAEIGYVYRLNSGARYLTCVSDDFVFQFRNGEVRGAEFYFEDGLKAIDADTDDILE